VVRGAPGAAEDWAVEPLGMEDLVLTYMEAAR
jgi:hypothetical protein